MKRQKQKAPSENGDTKKRKVRAESRNQKKRKTPAESGAKKNGRKRIDYSKRLISDIRSLLWIVTVGVLGLSALCIWRDYMGALPWLTAMVGLPWSAHAVVCSGYLRMAKSDHRAGGITYDAAAAAGFREGPED